MRYIPPTRRSIQVETSQNLNGAADVLVENGSEEVDGTSTDVTVNVEKIPHKVASVPNDDRTQSSSHVSINSIAEGTLV